MLNDPLKTILCIYVAAGSIVAWIWCSALAEPAEPVKITAPLKSDECGVKYLANGLIETHYDTDHDGKADRYTLTRTGRGGKPWPHPLFYGVDADGDGRWEIVYRDAAEDGVNGDEDIYYEEK